MAVSKLKRKGKGKFIMLEGYIMKSEAWKALKSNDIAVYLRLKWRYDGHNNGYIAAACRDLASECHISKNTAARSLKNLQELGFIVETQKSGFNMKNRIATEYRLTEYKCDRSNQLATKDFAKWRSNTKTTVPCEGQTVPCEGQNVVKFNKKTSKAS